jgi:hypothetical protein
VVLSRLDGNSPPALRARRAKSNAAGVLWAVVTVAGCATVIQEDLPSTLDSSPSAGGSAGAPSAAAGFTGSVTPGAGLGGNANGGGSSAGTAGGVSSGLGGRSLGGNAGSSGSPEPVDAGRQFPSGTLLLEEDFEAFESSEWRPTPDSVWEITTDDELQSNVYGQTETGSSGAHLVMSGEMSWTNVVVEADFKVLEFNGTSSGYMAGLCVRVGDEDNFYMVGLRSGTGQIQLRAFSDGGSNLEQSSFEDGVTGVWYHLRVEAVGTSISAYLDDVLMFTHSDASHPSGGIGLCTVRASAVFDNVRVTAP